MRIALGASGGMLFSDCLKRNISDILSSMVWHQFMRQVAHSTGLLFSRDMFKLPKGTAISRLVYLIGAFAGTGFYHAIVTIYATAFRAGLNPCGDLQFFVLQAFGMFMEGWAIDFVLWTGHGGNKTGWKYFGYLWFACWLGYSCLWYLEELRKAGLWDVDLKVLGYFGFSL
jgi:Membrane bound O-acyl transferase family